MNDPDETLSAIDAAIEGWNGYDGTVSPDAMRWAPEQPERQWHGARATLTILDEAHVLVEPARQSVTLTPEQVETFRRFADHVRRQHEVMRRAFQGFAKNLLKVVARTHATTAPAAYGDDYRRHRRTCRACNPAGNPKPLKVDGREYARRRKNRRRRGR